MKVLLLNNPRTFLTLIPDRLAISTSCLTSWRCAGAGNGAPFAGLREYGRGRLGYSNNVRAHARDCATSNIPNMSPMSTRRTDRDVCDTLRVSEEWKCDLRGDFANDIEWFGHAQSCRADD
jgi:hypothetical protein